MSLALCEVRGIKRRDHRPDFLGTPTAQIITVLSAVEDVLHMYKDVLNHNWGWGLREATQSK